MGSSGSISGLDAPSAAVLSAGSMEDVAVKELTSSIIALRERDSSSNCPLSEVAKE